MTTPPDAPRSLSSRERVFRDALERLHERAAPVLIGGALAYAHYVRTADTGDRTTPKDLDLCVRRRDVGPTLDILRDLGCRTVMEHPHWLAKAIKGDAVIDVIFSSGNGLSVVDDEWFEHSEPGWILGVPVQIAPAEESLWAKAFVMERERYDGADVAHLLRVVGHRLDWNRLLRRFDRHWPVLFAHLVLFAYVYPAERRQIPPAVWSELSRRLRLDLVDRPDASDDRCRGTLLSRAQYLTDIEEWGYRDERLRPTGRMTRREAQDWTEKHEPHESDGRKY